ncbi:MAG: acylphosphatase [Gulosibacter sp.]|uniref:acylphosphatase n=1 Tax=Gulosibacter sp. TaxID=2817531 RepID=UPI003F93054E
MTSKRVHALVSGVVQGVGYRWSTQKKANRLGVTGWVRNLPDGRVEFEAEGGAKAVDALLAWAAKGPRAARVDQVTSEVIDLTGSTGFDITTA